MGVGLWVLFQCDGLVIIVSAVRQRLRLLGQLVHEQHVLTLFQGVCGWYVSALASSLRRPQRVVLERKWTARVYPPSAPLLDPLLRLPPAITHPFLYFWVVERALCGADRRRVWLARVGIAAEPASCRPSVAAPVAAPAPAPGTAPVEAPVGVVSVPATPVLAPAAAPAAAAVPADVRLETPASGGGVAAAGSAAPAESPARPVQKNRTRCFTCSKKVGLTGFECRCSYVFCGKVCWAG
jgi:hypothetical protein